MESLRRFGDDHVEMPYEKLVTLQQKSLVFGGGVCPKFWDGGRNGVGIVEASLLRDIYQQAKIAG